MSDHISSDYSRLDFDGIDEFMHFFASESVECVLIASFHVLHAKLFFCVYAVNCSAQVCSLESQLV